MGRGHVRWVTEQFHLVDPPSGQLTAAALQVVNANLPIGKSSPSLEVRGCGKVEGWKDNWY